MVLVFCKMISQGWFLDGRRDIILVARMGSELYPILINVVCVQWNFPYGICWRSYWFGRIWRPGGQVRQRENSAFLFHVVEIGLYHRCDDQRKLFSIHQSQLRTECGNTKGRLLNLMANVFNHTYLFIGISFDNLVYEKSSQWTVQGELRVGFFSKREISAGEEVTFDYQLQRYGYVEWINLDLDDFSDIIFTSVIFFSVNKLKGVIVKHPRVLDGLVMIRTNKLKTLHAKKERIRRSEMNMWM